MEQSKQTKTEPVTAGTYLPLSKIIDAGLCTHCGSCVGLSDGSLQMIETERGPLPTITPHHSPTLPDYAYTICPAKGVDYPQLYRDTFGSLPENWLLGNAEAVYIGYAARESVRLAGASGGVITQTLIYLLETGQIDGAVVVKMGQPKAWQAEAIIATTADEILACAQSVYHPVPVNVILREMAAFNGRLAYVGLPDQVASLRLLQKEGHEGANKVDYVLGPYVGTAMYQGAIENFLHSNGVDSIESVAELRYRDGEWPGHLKIRLNDGRVFKAEKFYYNYLIPFYITRACRLAVDFTNELTDISVGDAWSPVYEAKGAGFSVVVARSKQGDELLQKMAADGVVALEETAVDDALSMHGHMLDFKKRGTFVRMGWRKWRGQLVPDFGYHPADMPVSRKLVEIIISGIFVLSGTKIARKLVEWMPIKLIGPLFNSLRKGWKNMSKPTKRKGLGQIEFEERRGGSRTAPTIPNKK